MKFQLRMLTLLPAIFSLTVLSTSALAQNNWESVAAPPTGKIFSLLTVGNSVFAGTERGGYYESADGGQKWQYGGLTGRTVRTFYKHSDGRVFAGLQNGLDISTDNGATWESSGLTANENAFGVAVNSSGHIFAGGWGYGVHRSTDDGATFGVLDMGASTRRTNELAVDDADVLYAGLHSGGIRRSTDNGDTWLNADATFDGKTVGCFAVTSSAIFAGVQYLGVFKSTDHGVTWVRGSGEFTESTYSALLADGTDRIFAATHRNVYLSTDAGGTWVKKSSSDISTFGILSLTRNAAGQLVLGTDWGGVFLSDDDGATWVSSSTGITNLNVESMATMQGGKLFLAHRVSPIGLSTDRGMSWQAAGNADFNALQLFTAPSGALYAAKRGGVFFTTDQGMTWLPDTVGMPNKDVRTVAVNAAGDIIAASYRYGCFRRGSGDPSWSDITNELTGMNLKAVAFSNTAMFAGTTNKGVFRSTDNGASWTDVSFGLVDNFVNTIVYDPVRGLYVGCNNGVSRSTDNGESWERMGFQGLNGGVTSIVLAQGEGLVVSSASNGVFFIAKPDMDWVPVNDGLYNAHVKTLVRDEAGYYYAGTEGNGVFRIKAIVVSNGNIPSVAVAMTLEQNYPNPFNPSTTISYTLPAAGHVSLKVFNTLGVEVATLFDGFASAGTHSVSFEASGLQSGYYSYQLRSGDVIVSRAMLLVK